MADEEQTKRTRSPKQQLLLLAIPGALPWLVVALTSLTDWFDPGPGAIDLLGVIFILMFARRSREYCRGDREGSLASEGCRRPVRPELSARCLTSEPRAVIRVCGAKGTDTGGLHGCV